MTSPCVETRSSAVCDPNFPFLCRGPPFKRLCARSPGSAIGRGVRELGAHWLEPEVGSSLSCAFVITNAAETLFIKPGLYYTPKELSPHITTQRRTKTFSMIKTLTCVMSRYRFNGYKYRWKSSICVLMSPNELLPFIFITCVDNIEISLCSVGQSEH